MVERSAILSEIEDFLRNEVAPFAQEMDRDPVVLRKALLGMAARNFLALKRPPEYGGPNISDAENRAFQFLVARYSGALAFLQTQHQGVVGIIAGGHSQALKDEYLPQMGDGRKLVGVGFSQLRRPGPPIMRAVQTEGGFLLNGHVPWVTGFSFYSEFMIGAALPDGQAVFGLVPLVDGPGVQVSPPMNLCAFNAAMTVTVDLSDFFLADSRVAVIRPAGWIQNSDAINIAQQGAFAMGCAQAALDILEKNVEKRKLCVGGEVLEQLTTEMKTLIAATEDSQSRVSEDTTEERLKVRAWQIEFAARCALSAVVSTSGAANSLQHPAQRVYREAMVFSVTAQTGPIMDATLRRVAENGLRA